MIISELINPFLQCTPVPNFGSKSENAKLSLESKFKIAEALTSCSPNLRVLFCAYWVLQWMPGPSTNFGIMDKSGRSVVHDCLA